jgi:hypothetical protein
MGKSSKTPMKSTRRAMECAAVKPASGAREPAAVDAPGAVSSTTATFTAAMRSCAGRTGLEERGSQQQRS